MFNQELLAELGQAGYTSQEIELLTKMKDTGVTLGELVEFCLWDLERAGRFMERLEDFCHDTVQFIYPNLYQEGEEGDWEGQPIVWDGVFWWDEDHLSYSGAEGPSGWGGDVSRRVRATDIILL